MQAASAYICAGLKQYLRARRMAARNREEKRGIAILTSPCVDVVLVAHQVLAQVRIAALESREMQRSR